MQKLKQILSEDNTWLGVALLGFVGLQGATAVFGLPDATAWIVMGVAAVALIVKKQ